VKVKEFLQRKDIVISLKRYGIEAMVQCAWAFFLAYNLVASAIAGAVSAAVFGMENIPEGAGMGTSGLVWQFGAFTAIGFS